MVLTFVLCSTAPAADRDRLIYHAETLTGEVLASERADTPFNPASVVKVGTSMWALDRLGPTARYDTTIGYRGTWDRDRGTIAGSLVLHSGGDPDFHLENAFWIAAELNRRGVRKVDGDLLVVGPFTMGWENGVERTLEDATDRARHMGGRLLWALDPARWSSGDRAVWREFCARRGWDPSSAPSVRVSGSARYADDPGEFHLLVVHGSNPLPELLRRFNVYSNNDIVRVADGLGGPGALTDYLRDRLGAAPHELDLGSASGQNRNRMTARIAVRLMREFRAELRSGGLELDDLLPIPGCDPGPTSRMFPMLVQGPDAHAAVVKTGTLTTTDGGVVVLAGAFESLRHGTTLFCVAATGTGTNVVRWRGIEQAWLLDLIHATGGAAPRSCGPRLPFSDSLAVVHDRDPEPPRED